jgi:hypothetical protein
MTPSGMEPATVRPKHVVGTSNLPVFSILCPAVGLCCRVTVYKCAVNIATINDSIVVFTDI